MKTALCQQLRLGLKPFPANRVISRAPPRGPLAGRVRRGRGGSEDLPAPSEPGSPSPSPSPPAPSAGFGPRCPAGRWRGGAGPAPEGGFGSGPRGAMDSLWRLKRFDAFPKTRPWRAFGSRRAGARWVSGRGEGGRGPAAGGPCGPALGSGSGRRRRRAG